VFQRRDPNPGNCRAEPQGVSSKPPTAGRRPDLIGYIP